jgi:two-component system CheB/CheR fusion protein
MENRPQTDGQPPLQILIIEDDGDSAESLAFILNAAGHCVRVANDGPKGLHSCKVDAPDVILLDLGLPGMDGFAVAKQLRAQDFSKRPLIIAVTGYGEPEVCLRSYEVGIDLHLLKPVAPQELLAVLKRFQELLGRKATAPESTLGA